MNAEMASTTAMEMRLVTMYRGAITVNVRKDLLETESTVKVQVSLYLVQHQYSMESADAIRTIVK